MTKETIEKILTEVINPATGESVAVESITIKDNSVTTTIALGAGRNPFAASIKRNAATLLKENFPQSEITVILREGEVKKPQPEAPRGLTSKVGRIVAIASGKGGVGKSTVAVNLAVALTRMGYKVGLLDADIYGPSAPKMLGLEDYVPVSESIDGRDMIVPAESFGVKVMSIGFFIKDSDALIWRGAMATNALRQLINQTAWGELDFLLIDMPPGTGDVHLTLIQDMKIDGAVIVSTPQQVALADVVRGIAMFKADKIEIPVLGIVENMAWFTPEELPENRYYIFGRGGAVELARKEGIDVLGQIPVVESVMQGADDGVPAAAGEGALAHIYQQTALKIVDKLH